MTQLTATLSGLESGPFTPQFGPSINPITADWYQATQLLTSVLFSMWAKVPNAAVLFKHVEPLKWMPNNIVSCYSLRIGAECAVYGRVIELDVKTTGPDGLTYPGDFQINIAENWRVQISNPWIDTSIVLPAMQPGMWNILQVHRAFDYVAKTVQLTQVDLNGISYKPAVQMQFAASAKEWATMEIVDQIQMCSMKAGGYNLEFGKITHQFS